MDRERLIDISFPGGHGVSAEAVQDAEARLGGSFPPDFVEFLRTTGWAEAYGSPLFGLGHSDENYDVVAVTLAERRDGWVPPDAVVVYNDGAGNLSFFRLSETAAARGEPVPIYVMVHDEAPEDRIEVEGRSYDDWLEGLYAEDADDDA